MLSVSGGADTTGKLWGFGVLGGSGRRATDQGRLTITTVVSGHHVWELIGRAIVLRRSDDEDGAASAVMMEELGTSSAEQAIAAVIARSAGVGVNHKMLCACDGTVIWDAEALLPGGSGRARPEPPMSSWMRVAQGGVPWPVQQ